MSEVIIIDRVVNMPGFWICLKQYIAQGHSLYTEYLLGDQWIQKPVKDLR